MENKLHKNCFGAFLETPKGIYAIKQVIIFKDNKKLIIANMLIVNYFLDNFRDKHYEFEFEGETPRKLKEDLTLKTNFILKSEKQDYDLYLNADLVNYEFIGLELIDDRLDITYKINGVKCYQCIGWNHKQSNIYKYNKFEEAYKNIHTYCLEDEGTEQRIKDLMKAYKNYKKWLEIEKTYTVDDYKKMSLYSSTTFEENITMLKNNGYDISGIKEN